MAAFYEANIDFITEHAVDPENMATTTPKPMQKLALKDMVQRHMRSAILEIGSFWYSAWVDAGQLDLNKLIDKPLSFQEKKRIQREAALYRMGKILEHK